MTNANTKSAQVIRNVAANYLTLIAQTVSGVVVTPIVFRSLGTSAFGTFAFVTTLVGYLGLLEAGIGTATLRFVAVRAVSGSREDMEDVLGSSRALYVRVCTTFALAGIPLAVFAPSFSGTSGATPLEVRLMVVSLVIGQVFGLMMNVYPAYVHGIGRGDVLFTLGTGAVIVTSVVQIVVAVSGGGVAVLALATSAVTVINACLIAHVAKVLLGRLRASSRRATAPTKRALRSLGLKNAGVSAMAGIAQQSDLVVIGTILRPRDVAAYAVAARACGAARSLATRAADVLVPTFADAGERGDRDRQFRMFVDASLASAILLHPVAIISVFLGPGVLHAWLGEVVPGSSTVLALLLVGSATQVFGHVGFVFFSGRGELGIFMKYGSVLAVINLLASIWLTKTLGVCGPALGTLATVIVFDLALVPCAVMATLQQRPSGYYMRLARVLAPPGLITILGGTVLHRVIDPNDAPVVIGAGVGMFLLYALTVAGTLGSASRRRYLDMISRRGTTA